jgi:hypothetical protein
LYFLRGLVPWNGYTVYTAAGIMLYFFHFPEEEDDDDVLRQCRDRVVKGCEFLRDMKNSWPMADSWVRIFPFTCLDDANNNIARNSQKDADFLHQHQH